MEHADAPAFAEWEGHKENIQPLKQGRKPSELRKQFGALQTLQDSICYANHNDKHKLTYERNAWEQRVMQPSMDPLATWLEFLTWIENNYPNLPPQSRYVETLQALTKTFVTNPDLKTRYKNDERLISVWLKYANMCEDPSEVFTFMDTNGIGSEDATFHIQWATYLEARQDYKAADAVLQLGVKREAQPLEKMKTAYDYYSHRFAKFLRQQFAMGGNSSTRQTPTQREPQRAAFNPMTSSMVKSQNRPLTMATPSSIKPMKMQRNRDSMLKSKARPTDQTNFTIFTDENAKQPSTRTLPFQLENQNNSWNYLPTTQETTKENVDRPSSWSSHTVPQTTQAQSLSLIQAPTEEFTIFTDE